MKKFFFNTIPKPHLFVTERLENNLELTSIITEINVLLPQLSDFITQFYNFTKETGVNVITDISGNMSMDIPNSMSDTTSNYVANKIGVIDRLITHHGQKLDSLFLFGIDIEQEIKAVKPEYTSQLTDSISRFKELNASYKH
jgi:hypothetical protein